MLCDAGITGIELQAQPPRGWAQLAVQHCQRCTGRPGCRGEDACACHGIWRGGGAAAVTATGACTSKQQRLHTLVRCGWGQAPQDLQQIQPLASAMELLHRTRRRGWRSEPAPPRWPALRVTTPARPINCQFWLTCGTERAVCGSNRAPVVAANSRINNLCVSQEAATILPQVAFRRHIR